MDAKIRTERSTVFRSDRKLREQGGVVIYVREDIAVAAEFTHSRSTHPQTGPGLGDNIPVARMLRIQVQGIFSGGDGLALQTGDRT